MWHIKRRHFFNRGVMGLSMAAIGLTILLALAGADDRRSESNHNVYIAFGFHVNLYHSFRNDTNDDSGFGKDIRIIRHIIRALDQCNANGVPVKGVWDFDNLFSLQEILPRYAPDIISDIRRRVHENGDEVILMSYNNGLVSAMTRQELEDAVRWSISNPWQSGVRDLFGTYTPIVRPQEMMTTPGSFSIYRKYGVQAVALYYSATPFDTFRVFSRPLSRAEAHNPMLYRNPQTKEEMVVIPTYHIGDLVEHTSLKHWVGELRDLQQKGELNQDALIFINYDADSELWSGVDLPWIMDWLPNTSGISGLVSEVQGFSGVHFTGLGEYLAGHRPVGTFSFSQDTADGSFDGYQSWAEKAEVPAFWATIERSRRAGTAARKAMAILKDTVNHAQLEDLMTFSARKRLRALSTTHFGMATPFVARQRERAMAGLAEDLNSYADQAEQTIADGFREYMRRKPLSTERLDGMMRLDTLLVLQPQQEDSPVGIRFLKVPIPVGYAEGMVLALVHSGGEVVPVVNLGGSAYDTAEPMLTLYVAGETAVTDGIYDLCAVFGARVRPASAGDAITVHDAGISNGRLALRFKGGRIEGVDLDGIRQVEAGSLMPYLKWDGRTLGVRGALGTARCGADGRTASFRLSGPLPGPEGHTVSDGWMDYRYTVMAGSPYLLVQGRIQYPSTEKRDLLKAATPGLMRRTDLAWQEVAPAEIRFAPQTTLEDPVRILKRNYLGVATEYALDYFRHSERNLNLDNVNNHITESYVGIVAGSAGMGIGLDTSVLSTFAFAPLKMRYHARTSRFSLRVNPLGTYYGRQYTPPTWGNGNGFDATLVAGEQFASAGPTYNDATHDFSMMLAFFSGRTMPDAVRRDLIGFAHPPMAVSLHRIPGGRPSDPSLEAPQGFVAAMDGDAVQFGWDNHRYSDSHYRIYCGTAAGRYEAAYSAVGNSLRVSHFNGEQPFVRGRRYVATIERVLANGQVSPRAGEIRFVVTPVKEKRLKVPLKLELKVLWASLQALLTTLRL